MIGARGNMESAVDALENDTTKSMKQNGAVGTAIPATATATTQATTSAASTTSSEGVTQDPLSKEVKPVSKDEAPTNNQDDKPKSDSELRFQLARMFYRQEQVAAKLGAEVVAKLSGLRNQAVKGPFDPENNPSLGFFDFVGKARRKCWIALEDLPKTEAMQQFCDLLVEVDPKFKGWLQERLEAKAEKEREEAKKAEEEKERKRVAEEKLKAQQSKEALQREQLKLLQQNPQEYIQRQLQSVRQQHLDQHRHVTQQQLAQQQQASPHQLPELKKHHAQQQQQLHQQQQQQLQTFHSQLQKQVAAFVQQNKSAAPDQQQQKAQDQHLRQVQTNEQQSPKRPGNHTRNLSAPNAEMKKQVPTANLSDPEFIEKFRASTKGPDERVEVKQGEIFNVRVPKPGAGKLTVTWKFNTIDYDIGFGVDFETPDGKTEELVPIARQNSHERVVVGSNCTDKEGTWILKFDNSFSYWRAKTVYCKVVCRLG